MSRAEDFIQGMLNRVPGYQGYRDKEQRRDEDKKVRVAIADALTANVDTLTSYNAQLAKERAFEELASLESAVGQIRLLADRIRTTSYGYGGIFTDDSVDAAALEQLRQFDSAMLREVDALTREVQKLTAQSLPDNEARTTMLEEVARLNTLFNSRSSVVDQGKPSRDAETIQLLSLPEVVEPSPLLDVKKGDALSVLGDNYIANGVITLRTSDGTIRLIRVSTDQKGATWLLGSDISGVQSASLTEQSAGAMGYQTMSAATGVIDTESGTEKDVAARFAYRNLGDNRVEFSLAIGDTIKQFSGTTIVDNDVEVYGVA